MTTYEEKVLHCVDSEILEKVPELLWYHQPLRYLKLNKVWATWLIFQVHYDCMNLNWTETV